MRTASEQPEINAFLKSMSQIVGPSFHLDTPACDYVNADGSPTFTPSECAYVDGMVERIHAEVPGDPYEYVMARLHTPALRQATRPVRGARPRANPAARKPMVAVGVVQMTRAEQALWQSLAEEARREMPWRGETRGQVTEFAELYLRASRVRNGASLLVFATERDRDTCIAFLAEAERHGGHRSRTLRGLISRVMNAKPL